MRTPEATARLQWVARETAGRCVMLYGMKDEEMTREELIAALRFTRMQADRASEAHAKDLAVLRDMGTLLRDIG